MKWVLSFILYGVYLDQLLVNVGEMNIDWNSNI